MDCGHSCTIGHNFANTLIIVSHGGGNISTICHSCYGGDPMYSPKIREHHIRPLYILASIEKKPMTKLVDEIIAKGIEDRKSLFEGVDIDEITSRKRGKKAVPLPAASRHDGEARGLPFRVHEDERPHQPPAVYSTVQS